MFGETVASSLTGKHPPTTKKEVPVLDNGKMPGIVTIIDIQNVGEGVVSEHYFSSKESFHWIHCVIPTPKSDVFITYVGLVSIQMCNVMKNCL